METFSRGTLDPQWVTGFADGAASFTYSRSGKQIALYFAVKLAACERPVLEELQRYFDGAGRIYDVAGRSAYYRISKRDELGLVLDQFDQYPLRSSKQLAYDLWRLMVLAKQQFRHPDRAQLSLLADRLTSLSR